MRTRTGRQPAPWGIGFGVLNGMAKKTLGGPAASFALTLLAGLSNAVTFSRGTNATMFDSQGRLVWAPANHLLRSDDPTLSWTNTDTTPSLTGEIAPSGAPASLITEGSAGTALSSQSSSGTIVTQQYTLAAEVKKGNTRFLRIRIGNGSDTVAAWVDFDTGTISAATTTGTSTAARAPTISPLGNDWFLVSVTGNTSTTGTTGLFCTATASGSSVRVANGTYITGRRSIEPWGLDSPKLPLNSTTATAYYGPRFDYDPLTLSAKGLLVEGQRVNLQPISQGATTDWTANFATITSTGALIHGNSAYTFTVTSVGSAQSAFLTTNPGALTASTAYVSSVRVKKGSHSRVQFTVTNNIFLATAADAYLNYNFDTDTLVVSGSASPTGTRTRCADGSVILTLAYTSGSAPTAGSAGIISLVDSDSAVRLAGTATNGATVHILGVQLEQAAFASSYIPTSGVAATRNSDYPTISGTSFSSWYNQTAGTFVVEGDVAATTADASSRVIFGTSSGAFNDSLYLARQTSLANIAETIIAGGVSQGTLIGGTTSPNTPFKAAYAYAAGDFAISVNSGATVTQAAGSLPATQVQAAIGAASWGNTNNLFGHIRQVTYYPSRLTDAQLQALST